MEKQSVVDEERSAEEEFSDIADNLKKYEMVPNELKENKVRNIISNELQSQMKEIKRDLLDLVNNRISDMVLELLQKMDKVTSVESRDLVESEIYCNRTKPKQENTLPTKQFLQRNSLLTDLYEIKHIRTIYNLIISTLIILLIHTAVYDVWHTGYPNLAINTIRRGFGKLSIVIYVWSLMKSSAFGVYVALCYWATRRLEFSPNSFSRKIWDYTWLLGNIVFQLLFVILPVKAVIDAELPVASSMIILMEQVRLIMKTHAFVRTVTPRILAYKPHSDTPTPEFPDFSKFLYFMFAPTLIYQDTYPRTKKTRWNLVLTNFGEVITIVFFVAIIYERLLHPTFKNFGAQPTDCGLLTLNILRSVLAGMILFVCGFYCLLHSWMNAFAELLRFADKMFYKDWWNSVSFSAYYRTWNIVVHDWLYTYIYKDMYEIIVPGNKKLATCAVFVLSALFHEYILCFTFHFFYPVMLILFGVIGLSIVFVFKNSGNIFVWFSLSIGNGIMVSLYCMEYFARVNCAPAREDFLDFVIPRSWTCMLK